MGSSVAELYQGGVAKTQRIPGLSAEPSNCNGDRSGNCQHVVEWDGLVSEVREANITSAIHSTWNASKIDEMAHIRPVGDGFNSSYVPGR